MVLWTRLTGERLGERETVRWEVAADEKFQRIVARGDEVAEAAWGHSVHAEPLGLEPGRWYWYRFARARRAERRRPHPHRAGRRCEGDAALRGRELPALRRRPLRRLAPCRRREPRLRAVPRRLHLRVAERLERDPPPRRHGGEDAGRVPRPLRHLQERPAAAGGAPRRALADGLGRPRGRQRLRQPAEPGPRARLREPARRRLPGLLGAHAVSEVGATARPGHAHRLPPRLGRAGAHPPGRRPPVPRSAGLPQARPRRLEHDPARRLPGAASTRSEASSGSSRSAGWPRAGTWRGPGTCSASRR